MAPKLTWRTALFNHWPEYLIEAWALGMFMVSASLFTLWFEQPGSALNRAIMNSDVRRGLIGPAMGMTAILPFYSPWGKRSSAQPGGLWHAIWIYFTAPVLGMWTATRLYNLADPKPGCARLSTHSVTFPCIHCGYTP